VTTWLRGKKSYITALLIALASFAVGMDWLTQTQYQVILGLLGSMGLAALKSGQVQATSDAVAQTKQNIKTEIAAAPVPFPGVDAGGPGAPGS